MARLRQRGPKRWEIILELGTNESGRRKQKSISHTGDRSSAELALARAQIKHAEGYFETTGISTVDLCEARIAFASSKWSPMTLRNYKQTLSHVRLASWANEPVTSLSPSTIESWYATGSEPHMLQAHRFLRSCFNHALKTDLIQQSVFRLVSPPTVNSERITPPHPTQIKRLLEAAKDAPIVHALIALAVSTGCRRGTLHAHQAQDFQDRGDQKELHVKRRCIQAPGGAVVLPGTKTGPGYVVPLGESTATLLSDWIERLDEESLDHWGTPLRPDAYLFSVTHGRSPVSPGYVSAHFQQVRKSIGGRPIRFHDLRHFAATQMLAAGIPIATVSQRLDHASPAITMSVYAHSTPELDQKAADVCDSVLDDLV